MQRIYMDHSATTPVDATVLETMLPYFREKFGNASSIHQYGQAARAAVEEAREKVAHLINAKSTEIVFLSGGTEADNYALQGVATALRGQGNHIITSKVEHHAVLHTCEFLAKNGFSITYLEPDQYGMIHPEMVAAAITPQTILISIMHANNEIGTINPIEKIGKITREHGILFHTDAVQSFGKLPIDVEKMNIDLLSASAHKLYGPKGVGMIYIGKGTKINKLIYGGAHEHNQRAGTENVAGIVGFGKAVEICETEMIEEGRHLTALRNAFWQKIQEAVPEVYLNGHPYERLPGNLNLSFAHVEGESLLLSLDMKGIAASSGSACSSGSDQPSHVLTALQLPTERLNGSLRISLGRSNTKDDINYAVAALKEIVERLRAMAPSS